jgi:O-antigen/teichoic acid export membrane protein
MYDEYDGSASFNDAIRAVLTIGGIAFSIYLIAVFIIKTKQRKLRGSIMDILKLVWMVSAVVVILYLVTLFFPELSAEAWNKKFADHLPFKKGFLGAITSIATVFLILMFCMLGIGTYFENPKQKDRKKDTKY